MEGSKGFHFQSLPHRFSNFTRTDCSGEGLKGLTSQRISQRIIARIVNNGIQEGKVRRVRILNPAAWVFKIY